MNGNQTRAGGWNSLVVWRGNPLFIPRSVVLVFFWALPGQGCRCV